MESRYPLRFWRVLLWGTISFLLFSALFWFLWDAYLTHRIHEASVVSVPPNPLPIYLVSAILTLLFTVLSIFALWRLRVGREAAPLLYRFLSQKGNGELCVHLLLLVLLLTICSSVWKSEPWTTCRCCLFTTESVCSRVDFSLSSPGFYRNTSDDGIRIGIYKKESKGVTQTGVNKFSFETVHFVRTRYGWPYQTITIDAAPDKFEWHAATEIWFFPNLMLLFLGWLSVQSAVGLVRWLLRRIASTV